MAISVRVEKDWPVKFETIGGVSVSRIFRQILGEIDNLDGLKRAFLHSIREMEWAGFDHKIQAKSTATLTLTQIPQPMQRDSEMKATLLLGSTSIHSFPGRYEI